MNHHGKKPIAIIETQCSLLLKPLVCALEQAGLWVMQSFDYKNLPPPSNPSTCSMNCGNQCVCELAVLLVYPKVGNPITLILDGRDGRTSIFFTAEMENHYPTPLIRIIEGALEKTSL